MPTQISASLYAIYLKLICGGKVITRCGYDWLYQVKKLKKSKWYCLFVKLWSFITYKFSDSFFVTSLVHYNQLKDKYANKIYYIPNAVDENLYKPIEPKKIDNKNSILCVGRLEYVKNYHSLIKACNNLNFTIHFVGDGSMKKKLSELAEKNNVKCIFHGFLDRQKIVKLYNKTYIYALPSYSEGASQSLIESMFCKAIILASNIDANKEMIKDNETGFLCGVESEQIREKIFKILENEKQAELYAENAYKFALSNFSYKKMIDSKIKMMEKVLRRNK